MYGGMGGQGGGLGNNRNGGRTKASGGSDEGQAEGWTGSDGIGQGADGGFDRERTGGRMGGSNEVVGKFFLSVISI